MKSFIISILSLFLLISFSFADETGVKFKLGLMGGGSSYWGDISDNPFGWYYEGGVDYWGSNFLGIGFNYGKGYIYAEDDTDYFKSDLWIYNFLFRIKPWPKFILNPQLIVGFDVFVIDPKGRFNQRLPNLAAEKYEKMQYAIPIGAGFSVFFTEYLSLDVEGLYHYAFTDYIDDLELGSAQDGFLTISGGLSFYFGKAKDVDKDGIPDKRDKEPRLPEDFDGFEDEDGAPDVDNDGDGIHDSYDKAPMEAEDLDGFQDDDGIPDLDNDNDGILDESDACPGTAAELANNVNTKEDFDGFELPG